MRDRLPAPYGAVTARFALLDPAERLCDPCEPLYLEWARLEAARGRPEQIPRIWRRLQHRYAADADDTAAYVATPTPETELAFTALLTRT